MNSIVLPSLSRWFDAEPYREHNECQLLEIRMKDGLHKDEIKDFCLEFAKYICYFRCPNQSLLEKMIDAIEKGILIDDVSKIQLKDAFFNGFISENIFQQTNNYKQSFDDDGIKGYFGEALYYLIRDQFVIDDKVSIAPIKPKNISKTPGIDFLEVRKDSNGYYFVVGEVKTSSNSYSTRNNEVIKVFLERINKNFAEIYTELKNQDDESDPEYSLFLEGMLDAFYSFNPDERKRLVGVFNYGYNGRRIPKDAFSNWKDQEFGVKKLPICRRIKVIGIYDIDNVITQVRDILWNVL